MAIRKRNEFLDGDESDEEIDRGYASEDSEDRGRVAISSAGPKAKRRRLMGDEGDLSVEEESSAVDEPDTVDADEIQRATVSSAERHNAQHIGEDEENEEPKDIDLEDDHDEQEPQLHVPRKSRTSAPIHVEAARRAAHKSGVVYISRVPPFMKPQTLKHFLSPHATKGIGRIFLTPEDHVAHARRVRSGGNKKKSFTDGWVEFISKRDAKLVADTLNGDIIGGKKGNFYHDDLWNLKYLKGFKWSHLTEQIANENAERAARMREEVRKTRQENRAFVQDVERGKMMETRELKRRARQDRDGILDDEAQKPSLIRPENKFKQKTVHAKPNDSVEGKGMERISRIGAMIM